MAASKDYAARSIAALEATNATLRAEVSSQAAHIAMLEEKLLTMSVELASSRAREDEQNLMLRRQQQLSSSQVTIMSEDSERSLGSGMGVSGLIGNIFNSLDRSDRSEGEGRRSSTMSDTDYSQELSSRRISMVGSLFRSRKSELTDDTVEEASREYEEEEKEEEEEHQPSSPQPQRRRPNRSLMAKRKSSRLISSTVAFPSLDDDASYGFTVDSSKFE